MATSASRGLLPFVGVRGTRSFLPKSEVPGSYDDRRPSTDSYRSSSVRRRAGTRKQRPFPTTRFSIRTCSVQRCRTHSPCAASSGSSLRHQSARSTGASNMEHQYRGDGGRPDQRRPLSARTIRAAAQRRRNIPPAAISAVSRSALASLRCRHPHNHRPSAPSAQGDRERRFPIHAGAGRWGNPPSQC